MRNLTTGLTAKMMFTRAPDGAPAGAPAVVPPAAPPPVAPPPAAPAPVVPPAVVPPAAPAPVVPPAAPPPVQPPAATAPTPGAPAAPQPSNDGKTPPSSAAPNGADAGKKPGDAASAADPAAPSTFTELPKPAFGTEETPPESDIDLGKILPGVLADEKRQADLKALCKERGMDSADAQALIAFYAKAQEAANAEAVTQQRQAYVKEVERLKAESRQDARVGGQNYEASIKAANRVVQLKGMPQDVRKGFMDALAETPHFTHDRRILAAFAWIGKTASEDSIVGTVTTASPDEPGPSGSPFSDSPGGLYHGKMGVSAESSVPLPALANRQ